MGDSVRQMALNLFVYGQGHHEAAWRHELSQPERIYSPEYYQQLAVTAEAAAFDAVFFADSPCLNPGIEFTAAGRLDPLIVLTTIAATTSRIGLIATASTSYSEPYNLARSFASVDHLSGGRVGWNIVTTSADGAAPNFGVTQQDPEARYARASEFTDVVLALWDSWEPDAIVLDKVAGEYADPRRIHQIDAVGEHFAVRGPLNVPRTPQGRPVLVQAGASNAGRAFAARYAEVIFAAQQELADAQRFYFDIKSAAIAIGRDPEHIKILPGISPFIGSTEAEASELEREFNELTVPAYGLRQLASIADADLSGIDLDSPVPLELFGDGGDITDNRRSRRQVVAALVQRHRPTVRELLFRLAGARGHRVVAGTPERIANELIAWFAAGAADGFNVMPPYLPGGLDTFAEHVVPILQRRGYFRHEYSGTTLRDHLGLPVPENQFAGTAEPAV